MPDRLTISRHTQLSFPPLSVTTRGLPYRAKDIWDAVLTRSIAFCSKSIQKGVRYLFPGQEPHLLSFWSCLCAQKKRWFVSAAVLSLFFFSVPAFYILISNPPTSLPNSSSVIRDRFSPRSVSQNPAWNRIFPAFKVRLANRSPQPWAAISFHSSLSPASSRSVSAPLVLTWATPHSCP